MDGIILVNKVKGITSRDLVNKACHLFNMKKIGHTGTLDPFAEGLMILTLGKATKISSYIEAKEKTYIGEMTLGIKTDTLDITGNIIDRKEVPTISKDKIIEIFNSFMGNIKQIPPMYSAIKVNGQELYKLARKGEVIDRTPRDVTIHEIKLLTIEKEKILFEVTCSKGTYIRSLVDDIGSKMGCNATLSLLVRTKVGPFHVKDSKKIEDIKESDVISISQALSFMPNLKVDSINENKIRNGVKIYLECKYDKILLLNEKELPLAIYERKDDGYYYCLRGLL